MLPAVRGVSLERKLPLLISLLLLVVIAVLAVSAYREVQQLAIAAARSRLESLASQFATSSTDGYRRRTAALVSAGHSDTLIRLVQSPTPATRAAAQVKLAAMTGDTSQDLGAQVMDKSGVVIFSLPRSSLDNLHFSPMAPDSAGFGPLSRGDTGFAYATSAPIVAGGKPIGRLVIWRRLQTSERAVRAVADLLGQNGALYVGNLTGDVWIDLAGHPAARPPLPGPRGGFVEFERGTGMQLATVRPMAGTPWLVEVDFPRSAVLAGQRVFLRWFAVIALVLLVAGVLASVILSRKLTRPLRELTVAAQSVAGGDYAVTIGEYGNDEVGSLARSFRVMAERVQASHAEQEARVTARTAELRAAMKTIEDTRDELVRKERLAILGQLSSGVGHELRNPLGVMNNAVYYLEAVLKDATPTTLEYLGILKTQIHISEKIVSDLLDFARIKKPDRHSVTMESVVAQLLKSVPPPANVRTVTELSPQVPRLYADPVHVNQILTNLASNAYQAMGNAGGTVTIRATPDGPGNVQIEVSDTGPGIEPENLPKVFEPLFTTKSRGIGLGLAVSRTLATTNGGSLSVKSPPGQGATFTLVLPVEQRGGNA